MISIQCQCGSTLTMDEGDPCTDRLCPDCGQRLRIACAETIPAGAGEADFDAMLVEQARQGATSQPGGRIALGGVTDISIGRLPGSTIELPGQKVSRRHARLIRVDFGPSRWKIADAGSSAGLFVNGQRILEHDLQPGDTIVIGEYTFEYTLISAPATAAELPAPIPSPLTSAVKGGFWTTPKIIAASAGGVLAVLIALGLAIIVPKFAAARATTREILCSNQLRQIGIACEQYEQQFGSYPPTLGDLAAVPGLSTAMFICPIDAGDAPPQAVLADRRQLARWINENTSYTYPGPAHRSGIVAYEKLGVHKPAQGLVVNIGGGVEQMAEAELERQLTAAQAALTSPPVAKPGQTPTSRLPVAKLPLAVPKPPRPQVSSPAARTPISLAVARKDFKTTLTRKIATTDPVEQPPAKLFLAVQYDAPPGKLAAYLTPDPGDAVKHPAIIWITGGDCNTIGDVWTADPAANDQTAAAYRKAGIIMMFPSLRGGNGNPGKKEGFYGEVDDILAAADYLAAQPYVDPSRIYLGGHSTGGTMALLVAECSGRFRAVISFGPVTDVTDYDEQTVELPFDRGNTRERKLRAPGEWLDGIQTPTFVFEGDQGNIISLYTLAVSPTSPKVQCFMVKEASHFSILAPTNKLIADKINRDTGPQTNLAFAADELPGLTHVRRSAAGGMVLTTQPAEVSVPPVPAPPSLAALPMRAGAKAPAVVGTRAGYLNRYDFPPGQRMVGIRYDLTKGAGPAALRSISAFTAKAIRPIRGTEQIIQARDGYIVHGLIVDADKHVNAIRIVFVRLSGNQTVPDDTYTSEWLGIPQTDKPTTLGGNGQQVTGIVFYEDSQVNAIGLTLTPER